MKNLSIQRQGEDNLKIKSDIVDRAIDTFTKKKGFAPSIEQVKAVRHLTENTGGVAVLSGVAGSGKTTASDLYSDAFRQAGYNMRGLAVGWDQAKKLEQELLG